MAAIEERHGDLSDGGQTLDAATRRDSPIEFPPFVSSSMITMFNECPRRWAAAHFYGKSGDSERFRFGTAFHQIVESSDGLDPRALRVLVDASLEDEEERATAYDAVRDLQGYQAYRGWRTLEREKHFALPLGDDLVLVGHVDHLMETADGRGLVIQDYKTNRQVEPAVVWHLKIQPRAYNYAVRRLYPQYESVTFQIYYVRYQSRVEWAMEDESEALTAYVRRVWRTMNEYFARGAQTGDPAAYFPELLNAYCGYCPVRESCGAYQRAGALRELPAVSGEGPGERYSRLAVLSKVLDAHKADALRQIRQSMAPDQKTYVEGGREYALRSQGRVKYDVDKIGARVLDLYRKNSVDMPLSRLFSLSVTGVAALLQQFPELAEEFEGAKTTTQTEPWLVPTGPAKTG